MSRAWSCWSPASRDGVVPHLVVGLGGIWTELLDDVTILPLPTDGRSGCGPG